ncbi:MAG: hypothetical protein ACREL4_09750, partial [Gemmatimonadales bacterium]
CAGSLTAFELGRRFHAAGAALDSVALFSAPFAGRYRWLPWYLDQTGTWMDEQAQRLATHARALASRPPARWGEYVRAKVVLARAERAATRSTAPDPALALRGAVERATLTAARHYRPRCFDGRLRLFVSSRAALRTRDHPLRWRAFAANSEVWFGPSGCRPDTMLREPHAETFAGMYRREAAHRPDEPAVESLAGV